MSLNKEGKDERPGYYVVANISPPSGDENVFARYVNILRRRIWTLAAVTLIFATVGIFNAFKAPLVYMAQAKVVVERDVPKVAGFEGVIRETYPWDPEFFNTQLELIKSRVVLEVALEDQKLRKLFEERPDSIQAPGSFLEEIRDTIIALLGSSPPLPPAPWERLRSSFSVKRILDTHFVVIQAVSAKPEIAAAIVNTVASAFETYAQNERSQLNGEAFRFLQKEREKEERVLAEAETALQKFREQAREIVVSSEKSEHPAVERLTQINQELAKVQLQRIELESHARVVQDIVSGRVSPSAAERLLALPAMRNDVNVSRAWNDYVEVQKKVRNLSRIYGPEHPALKEAQTNELVLKEELFAALNRSVQTQKDQLAILLAKEEQLVKQYEEEKILSVEASKEAMTLVRLQSELERHRRIHEALVDKLLEIDVSSGFSGNIVRVVELAEVPRVPVAPQRGRRIGMALVLGILAGVGLAFLVENLDETIRTPEDLREQFSIPLFGFVPPLEIPPEIEKNRDGYGARFILNQPVSSVAEAFRTIRTSLFFSIPSGETRAIAVTSCGPGEGKTTTVCNLAIAVAQSGKKVILVDADFHQPKVGRMLDLKGHIGLSDALVGGAEWRNVLQKVEHEGRQIEGLDVLVAGSPTPSPSELLGSEKMRGVISELKRAYDWIFIDVPPVLFVSDASIVCALSDGVILAVMAGVNNRSLLRRSLEHLEHLHVKVIGAVLTRMTVALVGKYASDYAYHGYSKYARDYHASYYGHKSKKGRMARAVERIK